MIQAKADMAVVDLDESKIDALLRFGRVRLAEAQRARHAAADGPHQAGAAPGQTFEDATPTIGLWVIWLINTDGGFATIMRVKIAIEGADRNLFIADAPKRNAIGRKIPAAAGLFALVKFPRRE